MAESVRAPRPLSPHLQIYRWTWTMAMSIAHRATGIALYAGTFLVAVWLVSLASGPRAYDVVAGFFGSWFGRLILFGYTWTIMHHMMGGLRHFVMDFGKGMDGASRMTLARLSVFASVGLTVLIWLVAILAR